MFKVIRFLAYFLASTATAVSHAQQDVDYDDAFIFDQLVPVAEDDGTTEEASEVASVADDATLTPDERLAREFQRYRRLVDEGAMDAADVSAKRIVELVIRIHGPLSLETSKALNNLALVQHRNGQYDAAIQNFESAVEIIEVLEDRLNEKLVNPLRGLGSAQLSNGRPDLARKTFSRAIHITHVNEGPHNIEQVELLESLAQTSLLMQDTKAARDYLDRIHVLNVRHFEDNPLALIPSLMRRATWQHAARYFNDERATYRRAIRIVESQLGKDDPQLIDPLIKLGESYYFIDLTQTNPQQESLGATGELYFKRATRIAEEAPDIGWRQLIAAKLALADHYIFVESHSRARRLYAEIWDLLSSDDERLATRAELLERPVVLVQGYLPQYVGDRENGNAGENLLTGTIRVDYNVSERGRVRNIRTAATPPEFTDMQRMVHREIRRRVFRPQMSEAELRESDNIVFTHTFYYSQSDLDELSSPEQQQSDETTDEESTT